MYKLGKVVEDCFDRGSRSKMPEILGNRWIERKKKKGEGMIEEEESRDGKEEKIVYRDDTEDLNEDEEDGRKKGG